MTLTFGSLSLNRVQPGNIVRVTPEAEHSELRYRDNLFQYGLVVSQPEELCPDLYEADVYRLYRDERGFLNGEGDMDRVRFSVKDGETEAFDAVDSIPYAAQLQMMFRNTALRWGADRVLDLLK